jgi:cell division protein FtsI (penicillin-binding protein 3)/stage V sporulation protein D (sporulation-specific penicillin-binding protein)
MNNSQKFSFIHLFSLGIIFIALILIVRLYDIQINKGSYFKDASNRQYGSLRLDKNFDRGLIVFSYRDGKDFFAASNQMGFNLAIDPSILEQPDVVYQKLTTIVPIDHDDFYKKAAKITDPYEELVKKIPEDIGLKISDLNLKGVILEKARWRFYPGNELASQVIGFISEKDNQLRGQYGLEREYDDILKKDTADLYSNIFVEFYSGIKKTFNQGGLVGDVVATIEPNVQAHAEQVANSVQDKYNSKSTGIIVMNPKNGEIIAMSQYPTFNLNDFGKVDSVSQYNNHGIEDVHEMGSIIKPLSMAIGIETKSVTAQTTYDDKGYIVLNNRTIYNHDKKERGVVDMQAVLNNSLNTGVSFVVGRVGNQRFVDYMRKLFRDETSIDLPAEGSPLISNLDSLRAVEVTTASFGQGIAITPIQTIRALAALGNGGQLVQPHVIKEIRYEYGVIKKIEEPKPVQIFSKETSEEISRMLVRVVDEALLGGTVKMENYSIAAKTGTAQIVDPNTGGYSEDRYLHSFFGYFPAFDPKFIVLLYTIEPKGVAYASHTLTLPFIDIAKYLINYYEIEPDR